MSQINLGDIAVDVILKDIENVHLSVHPPTGRVRISAPKRMSINTIRVFAISKLEWIKRQQTKLREQERETPRDYVDRESHFVWGRRVLLALAQSHEQPSVEVTHRRMLLRVRPGTTPSQMHAIVEKWYRQQVRKAVPALLARWAPALDVKVDRFFVQRMKTRWGSCSRARRAIRLNTDLAKKPLECLEYIVVHEMIHLIEPTHNARFVAMMDRALPQWRFRREQLNRLPVRHDDWAY